MNTRLLSIILMGLLAIGQFNACKEEIPNPAFDLNTFNGVIESGGNYEEVEPSFSEIVVKEEADSLIESEPWVCTTKKVSLQDGNETQPLFNPNASVIYPGNMLQGKSLNKATPDVIVVERAGGTISYDLNNGNLSSSFTVDKVSKSSIQDAMNNIINNAGEVVPANFLFTYEKVQSRQQLAVELGLDVDTRFVDVEANLSFSKDKSYNRYLVKLHQQYYTMSFDLPTSLDKLFDTSVTPKELTKYVGPGNPATYISDVTYGRIFYMLIESTETTKTMESSIEASFSNFFGTVEGSLDVASLQSLSNLKVKVIAIGGDSEGTISMIGETNLSLIADRMAKSTNIKAGLPLSYVVRNVYNNQIVNVKLATEYDITDCHPLYTGDGVLNFAELQQGSIGISTPVETFIGDVDGIHGPDVIFNHKIGASNQIKVAFNNGNGTFSFNTAPVSHAATTISNWTDYTVHVADINGDGKSDLVWNLITSINETFVALSNGDGTFDFKNKFTAPHSGWAAYRMRTGDMNGDGYADLVWNETASSVKRTYVGWGGEEGNITINNSWDFAGNIAGAKFFIGKFDGNSSDDILWHDLKDQPNARIAMSKGDGTFTGKSNYHYSGPGYAPYQFDLGDINGDGLTDMIQVRPWKASSEAGHPVWIRRANGSGNWFSKATFFKGDPKEKNLKYKVGDLDNDGKDDLIFYQIKKDGENKERIIFHVGYGSSDGTLGFYGQAMTHPDDNNWNKFEDIFVRDMNGDEKDDIVLINPAGTAQVYVAFSK